MEWYWIVLICIGYFVGVVVTILWRCINDARELPFKAKAFVEENMWKGFIFPIYVPLYLFYTFLRNLVNRFDYDR